ncbi:MAG: response regulator [Deltaproteobacteria bacterium]|nr:response regulator [Deltaproteobacteria bacterium]
MAGILFIDAEQPFSDQTAGALRARGYQVKQVDDGKDVLEHALKERPELIVLCVELPKMSGYSICNKLKKDNDLKSIPLIITSKEATPETFAQHKKLKTRAEEYLIKPFTEADLAYKVGGLGILPADGAAATTAPPPPPPDDSFEQLDSLGRDLELDADALISGDGVGAGLGDAGLGAAGLGDAGLGAAGLGDAGLVGAGLGDDGLGEAASSDAGLGDFGSLDALEPGFPADAGALSDDALLQGLDALNAASLDGLDALSSLTSAETDFGDPHELAPDAPAPAPKPAPVAPPYRPSAAARSPSTASSSSSSADLAALQSARRENSDLKARVAELEARLKHAEDSARASSVSLPPTGATSAREVLNLKQQLRAKDDEILQGEQALVDAQEQLERVQAELAARTDEVGEKDVALSTLKTRVASLTAERDDLEAQVRDRLQVAEAERDQAHAEAEAARSDSDARVAGLEAQAADAVGRVRALEQDLRAAQQRLRAEEQRREKARAAVDAVVGLLADS